MLFHTTGADQHVIVRYCQKIARPGAHSQLITHLSARPLPGSQTAIQHAHRLVTQPFQQPPHPRRKKSGAIIINDYPMRFTQILIQIQKDRAGQMCRLERCRAICRILQFKPGINDEHFLRGSNGLKLGNGYQ